MHDSKQEHKLSFKNQFFVLVCLALLLFGIVLFNNKFPALRQQLSDTLFIAMLVVMCINVFWKKK
jgi:glycerol uptake facilitator-like aquaporin